MPRHVTVASLAMGAATMTLGFAYAFDPPYRRPELEARSVVADIEQPLGWVMLALGAWVILATLLGRSRSSAHAVTAIAHGAHLVAITATLMLAFPYQSLAGVALSLFGVVAHGGASLDYWSRGWR